MEPPTTSGIPSLPNRRKYQYELATFKVEDELYRIPRHGFTQSSVVFKAMFTLPQAQDSEGTDDNPIELPSCTKFEFESLLDVLYPPASYNAPVSFVKEQWIGVLKLSTQWAMDEVRDHAIKSLFAIPMETVEKIILAKQFKISSYLVSGYTELIQTWGHVSLEELGKSLGWESTARIVELVMRSRPPPASPGSTVILGCPRYGCDAGTFGEIHVGGDSEPAPPPNGTPQHFTCLQCLHTSVYATVASPRGAAPVPPSPAPLSSQMLTDAIKTAFQEELDSL